MKKALIFLTFLLATIFIYADEQKKVKLDDGHPTEQVRLAYCNIFVTKVETDDDGNSKVTVEVENLDETNVIILFGHAYPEKELKRLSPSVSFDKSFPGTKGHRDIDTYKGSRNVIFIEPSEKSTLPEIQVQNEEVQLCRLPFYIAKYKNKRRSKILLLEKQIVELEIELEVKPDEDFLRLERESNTLIKEISRHTFCNNTKHRPSLKKQEEPYKARIKKIKTEIDEIIDRHKWFKIDRGYQKYNEIKQKLDSLDFSNYERDCGRHKIKPILGCKYCNLSPQQIYHKLDDFYKKIYSSNNRKKTKEALMSDVNLLYGCGKHSVTWKNSEYKSKITDRYNRINNF